MNAQIRWDVLPDDILEQERRTSVRRIERPICEDLHMEAICHLPQIEAEQERRRRRRLAWAAAKGTSHRLA